MIIAGIHERLLRGIARVVVARWSVADVVRRRFTVIGRDARGQTNTEYLMVTGVMAAVIVAVFAVAFWEHVDRAARYFIWRVWFAAQGDFEGAKAGPQGKGWKPR